MATTFFQDLFTDVDSSSQALIDGVKNVIEVLMPMFGAIFVVYCIFVILSYWENESSIHGMMFDVTKRVIYWAIILGFGVNISTYYDTFFPVVRELGEGLAMKAGGNPDAASSLDGIIDKLSQITDTNTADAQAAEDEAVSTATGVPAEATDPNVPKTEEEQRGILASVTGAVTDAVGGAMSAMIGSIGDKVMTVVQNVLIWIAGGAFLVMTGAYILIADMMLLFLAAVAPFFFACALFPATRHFFSNWCSQVLNFGFFSLFANLLARMFITYVDGKIDSWITNIQGGDLAVFATSLLSLLCMCFIFVVMLQQLPSLTAQLFGGLATGGIKSAASDIKAGGGFVKSSIVKTGRGVGSVSSWVAGKFGGRKSNSAQDIS